MGENFKIDVDTTEAESKINALDSKIEKTKEAASEATEVVDTEAKKSFSHVMGMMRSSYMVMSGVGRMMGGTMGRMFSAIYSLGISTVMTFKALAATAMATPGGQIQAAIMYVNILTAIMNLSALRRGQKDLSRSLSGFNTTLHGIGGMIDSFSM